MKSLKNILKRWFLSNMFELSTWIGLIILVMELLRRDTSMLMLILAGFLLIVPDTKLRQFMLKRAEWLKPYIEKL